MHLYELAWGSLPLPNKCDIACLHILACIKILRQLPQYKSLTSYVDLPVPGQFVGSIPSISKVQYTGLSFNWTLILSIRGERDLCQQ